MLMLSDGYTFASLPSKYKTTAPWHELVVAICWRATERWATHVRVGSSHTILLDLGRQRLPEGSSPHFCSIILSNGLSVVKCRALSYYYHLRQHFHMYWQAATLLPGYY